MTTEPEPVFDGSPMIGRVELAASLRQAAANYDLKQEIADLNKLLASYKQESQSLKERIETMRKGGDIDLQHEIDILEGLLKDRSYGSRVSAQRKEIKLLHGVIKRLKESRSDD